MDYKKKLKDPRWQKKKSEIMMRDKFTCQLCGSTENTLNVHHITYMRCKNGEPWSCPDSDLVTLCENCHREVHDNPDIPFPFDEKMTKEYIKRTGFEIQNIIGDFINRKGLFKYYNAPFTRIICVEKIAKEWGAFLEFTHYHGDFLGGGLKELEDAGWHYIWNTGTLYENPQIEWDNESLEYIPEINEVGGDWTE